MTMSPKSLTAVVHVRFHYEEPEAKPPSQGEIQILSSLMDRASELNPEMQEVLVKFASYLKKVVVG